jgi:DNA-binding transcriptional regulator YiaG
MSGNLLKFRRDAPDHAGEPLHYTACGLDNVYLLNGFTTEIINGEEYVTIENLDGLWKAIGLNLVKYRKSLAPKEIRFLRHHMDLTQAELAAQMRVTDQTVARWEKGHSELPGPADMMLRVRFLASEIAQPEGTEILRELINLVNEIIQRDEMQPKPVVFEHGRKRWKESTRELCCA